MLTDALILFAVAALAGASMAVMHFRGHTPPRPWLAGVHGVFAASGLVVLLLAFVRASQGLATQISLGLFVLAALGGFVLLSFHMRERALPAGLVVGHGLLAVAGFLVLLSAVFVIAS